MNGTIEKAQSLFDSKEDRHLYYYQFNFFFTFVGICIFIFKITLYTLYRKN